MALMHSNLSGPVKAVYILERFLLLARRVYKLSALVESDNSLA